MGYIFNRKKSVIVAPVQLTNSLNKLKQFTASAYGLNLVINKIGRVCEWKLAGTTTQELASSQYYKIADLKGTEFKPLSSHINIILLSTNGVCAQVQPRIYGTDRFEFEIGFFYKNGEPISLNSGASIFTHGTYISAK